jgi:hypothetical protein
VAVEGALEVALAGAGPQIGVGVEGGEPEGVAVAAVAGRRAGPSVAAGPEVVGALDRCGLALVERLVGGSSAQPSQWVKVPAGASGSSTTSASERVSAGAPDQESGGERSSPSQLCRRGIGPPGSKAPLWSAKSATRERMIESLRPRSVAMIGAEVWGGGRWSSRGEGGVIAGQRHPGHPASSVA